MRTIRPGASRRRHTYYNVYSDARPAYLHRAVLPAAMMLPFPLDMCGGGEYTLKPAAQTGGPTNAEHSVSAERAAKAGRKLSRKLAHAKAAVARLVCFLTRDRALHRRRLDEDVPGGASQNAERKTCAGGHYRGDG